MNFIQSLKDAFHKLSMLSVGITLGLAILIPMNRFYGIDVPIYTYDLDRLLIWWASYGVVSFIYNYFFEKNEL